MTASLLSLPLRDTFRIARESSDVRQNALVRLETADGLAGLGEAAPSLYYGQSAKTVMAAMASPIFASLDDPFLLEELLSRAAAALPGQRSALSALDMALHDWMGQRLGVPLYRLLGLNPNCTRATSYTIGLASLNEIRRKAEEAAGFPILKVKLGTDHDRAILATIRRVTSVPVRVDANAAWSFEDARMNLRWLQDEGVELVEQPLPPGDLDGLRRLTEMSALPIIADESAQTPEDVVRLRGCVHGVNIKLAKSGGLREALKMIHVARAQSMKVMIGCMIESSLGIAAAAHLSPLADYADLDGNLLLAEDPFTGLKLSGGRWVLPDRPGIGVVARCGHDSSGGSR
ncbi:MAG: dipeptide epimerase [Planctomycetes bacterium]|nr:dipeptide epimerase [Planctomycetota bacterium]